ncbi:MAG: PAS domain S-box protein [Deltaproteobacteria bacterium]|nr:PAS domain S-box protein [Deltaproteobacteria bacterium]
MHAHKALNVGIVGGGRGCKAVMDMILTDKLKRLRMKIIGVVDHDQGAVGYVDAKKRGIFTAKDYKDLYKLKGLHMIIELTGVEAVANEIARTKPDHVRFMDHVAARVFWDIFQIEEERIAHRKRAEGAVMEINTRLNTLIQAIPDVVYFKDAERRNQVVNQAFRKLVGLKQSEIIGKTDDELFPPDLAETCRKSDEEVLKRGRTLHTEERAVSGKGVEAFFDTVKKPLRDKKGKTVGLVGVSRNVTQRKQAEEAALEAERRYRLVVDNANDAVFIVQDGIIKFPNPATTRITGYSSGYLSKSPFVDLIVPEDRDMVVKRHMKRLEGKDVPTTYSFRVMDKAGRQMWVEVNAVLFSWEAEPAVLCFLRDITPQKKLEAQLQYAHKMEAVGTLAGGVAHDFNNLLMGIQGNVSLMLMEVDGTHVHYQRLKSIEKQIQSGARLTSHLLGYARKGKYEVTPIDLNHLVEEISHTFGRMKKEITVHQDLAKNLRTIEADAGQIEQVLLNLLVNAADAMPGGGALTLKTRNINHKDMKEKLYEPKPGKYVLLTVTDTGTGMYKRTLERIFDPFFTTKEMGRGTGLGLASAYGVIKSHAGYIDVDSKRGQGTTFSIYLPASWKKVERVASSAERIIAGTGTVLLVDDEEPIMEVGKEFLELIGYRVLTAQDGKEAVKTYRKHQDAIDVVVLDMVMPGMGGGEAYDRIKKINPDVKVLLSSGFSIDGEASDILDRGCNGFIQKPFTVRELSRAMEKIL